MCHSTNPIQIYCLLLFSLTAYALAAAAQPPPPDIDLSRASVPLEQVIFDTFGGPPLPLTQASVTQIQQLRNRIRPIYSPRYGDARDGNWLDKDDLVIGYSAGENAYAYPVKMLNFHEIVNDVIANLPVLISYCPLCASGVVYDRGVAGRVLTFGNTSALYQNDMVMFDHETGSYWFQTGGEAIVGELVGQRLRLLPSVTMTWAEWRRDYPRTAVLSRDQGFPGRYPYENDPFSRYPWAVAAGRFPFPVDRARVDDILPLAEVVITAEIGEAAKAYPLSHIEDGVVNDSVGASPVVLFTHNRGISTRVMSRTVAGRTLTFSRKDDHYVDAETRSTWDAAGRAIAGPLLGERLQGVPSRRAFWFSMSIALPGIEVWNP